MTVPENQYNLAEHLLDAGPDADAVAFLYKGQELSRRELRQLVAQTALGLRAIGLVDADRVVLLLADTPAFVVSFLAVLAVGAIPIPINPRFKDDSISYVLADSRARFVIAEEAIIATSQALANCTTYLKHGGLIRQDAYGIASALPNQSGVRLRHYSLLDWLRQSASDDRFDFYHKSPASIAFWQYTSGTTGQPKAVQHTQAGMLENTLRFAKQTLGITSTDKIYSVPKMFFGYGLGNSFFFPLLTGATGILDEAWPTADSVLENIRRFKPSVLFAVPNMYSALLRHTEASRKADFSSLRVLFSAGANLPGHVYDEWKNRFDQSILDGIGATEVGHVFLTNSPLESAAASTGRAVPGYEVCLTDEHHAGASDDIQGVLLVRGPSVSPGYWERPTENMDKFREGWYRTGDVFSKSPDGRYHYKGREDDLFKVKGRWVVPAKVEGLVHASCPRVREAVVVGVSDEEGFLEPILFLTCAASEEESGSIIAEVIDCLRKGVEAHSVPTRCVIIQEMPKNDNGKLLRRELIALARSKVEGAQQVYA